MRPSTPVHSAATSLGAMPGRASAADFTAVQLARTSAEAKFDAAGALGASATLVGFLNWMTRGQHSRAALFAYQND